jgi:predicted O-methyltransferase YrrM
MVNFIEDFIEKIQKPKMIGIEIGTWTGESLLQYLPTIKNNDGKMYVVDTFEGNPTVSGEHAFNPENSEIIYNQFLENTKEYKDYITILKESSSSAFRNINEQVDFIFIDGDHRYSSIKNDIKNYMPLLKDDGIMLGHDFAFGFYDINNESFDLIETDFGHYGVNCALFTIFGYDFEIYEKNGEIWYKTKNNIII